MRWEEPHHPGPGLQLERHNNPQSPTLQHPLPLQAGLQTGGRGRLRSVATGDEANAAAERAPSDANDLRGFHFKRLLRKPLIEHAGLDGNCVVIGAGEYLEI